LLYGPSGACPKTGHSDCTDKTGDTCPSRKSPRLDHSSNWPVRGSDKAAGAGLGRGRYAKGGTSNPGGSKPSNLGTAAQLVNAPENTQTLALFLWEIISVLHVKHEYDISHTRAMFGGIRPIRADQLMGRSLLAALLWLSCSIFHLDAHTLQDPRTLVNAIAPCLNLSILLVVALRSQREFRYAPSKLRTTTTTRRRRPPTIRFYDPPFLIRSAFLKSAFALRSFPLLW
jgi:hypothetical protein